MKTIYYTLCLIILINLGFTKTSSATHYMGGEITWECIPVGQADAGKFIFHIRYYRECYTSTGGLAAKFPTTLELKTTHPTVKSITMKLLEDWPKDISPKCYLDSGANMIICPGMQSPGPNKGAVQEYLYSSQPIALSGIPPSEGWTISSSMCCRNASNNLQGQQGWYLRAKMLPFKGKDYLPCFDSSPTFAKAPQTVLCTGYEYSYSHLAFDNDLDSLTYEWGTPMVESSKSVTYMPSYSYTNPLPDTTQDSLNVAAVMDLNTGVVRFTSYTSGAYVTSTKITAYKEGVKIAEVWREIQVVLLDCEKNNPPKVTPPFKNGTSYHDTVYVGDSVSFAINGSDFEFLPNGNPQTMYIEVAGNQFGYFVPPVSGGTHGKFIADSGCVQPPCAALSPAPGIDTSGTEYELSGVFGIQTEFNWRTSCEHLASATKSRTYYFSIAVRDSHCPAPARNESYIGITVLPKPLLAAPKTKSINFSYNTFMAEIEWETITNIDSLFAAYEVYYSNTQQGPFTLINRISDIDQTTDSYYTGPIEEAYFFIKTINNYCNDSVTINTSDTLSLQLTGFSDNVNNPEFILFQNEPNPAKETTTIKYFMNKEDAGKFILMDVSGQVVMQRELLATSGNNSFELKTSSLAAGVYYYQVSFGENMGTKRLLIIK